MKAVLQGLIVLICLSASTGYALTLTQKKRQIQQLNVAIRDLRWSLAIAVSQNGKTETDRQERLVQSMKMCELQQSTRAKGDFTFSGEVCPVNLQHTTLRYEYGRNQNGDPFEHKRTEQSLDVLNKSIVNLSGIVGFKENLTEVDDTLISTPVENHSWKKKIQVRLAGGEVVVISGETIEYTNMENDQKTLKATYRIKWTAAENAKDNFVLNVTLKQMFTQDEESTQESTIDGRNVHPTEIQNLLSSVL